MERMTEEYGMRRHYSSRGAGFGPRFLWNGFCIAADLTATGLSALDLEAWVLEVAMFNGFSTVKGFMYLWSSLLDLGN